MSEEAPIKTERKLSNEQVIRKLAECIINTDIPIIYFVRCNEFIKIGSSKGNSLRARLSDLQVGNPYKLKLETFIIGDRRKEKTLHKQLKAHKRSGEWYQLSNDMIKHLTGIETGNE